MRLGLQPSLSLIESKHTLVITHISGLFPGFDRKQATNLGRRNFLGSQITSKSHLKIGKHCVLFILPLVRKSMNFEWFDLMLDIFINFNE